MFATTREPAGRFRPASPSDFTLYARNLAWLLQCPLQQAQSLLAQGYGYADAHELRSVMEHSGTPGPFDEATRWPTFMRLTAPAAQRPSQTRPDDLGWMVETPFDSRWRELIQRRNPCDRLGRRELACLEAGFFCTPKVHRQLFSKLKSGILACEGTDEQSRAWLELHWPVGYWALLRILYGHAPTGVAAAGVSADTARHSFDDPRIDPAFARLCRFRAPSIYLLMSQVSEVPVLFAFDRALDLVERDCVKLASGEPGLYPEDAELLFHELNELRAEHGVERSPDEAEHVEVEILESHDAFLSSGGTDLGLLHPLVRDIPDYAATLRSFRFRQLHVLARAQDESLYESNAVVVLGGRRRWPGQYPACVESKLSLMELAQLRRDEMHVMLQCLIELREERRSITDGCHMSLWRYHAEFTQVYEDDGPAARVGHVDGWYIVPYDDECWVHPDDFFECMDAASAQLNDVWKVLVGEHFPSRGLASVNDFVSQATVEESYANCIATAEVELESDFRKRGLVPELLNQIFDYLNDAPASAVDGGWAAHAKSGAGFDVGEEEEDMLTMNNPGVPEFGAPGVFVIPVAGEPPTDRNLYAHLRGSLRKTRKASTDTPKEAKKRKLIKHFEAMRSDLEADLVCYDPYDYPAT